MMTNKICILALAALILSAMLILTAAVFPTVTGNAAQTSGSICKSEDQTSYTVRSCGSCIGIFVPGSDEPIKTIAVNPDSLPKEAQLLLEKGITVSGHDELLLLIEDYTG